jgi:hypothetical protein
MTEKRFLEPCLASSAEESMEPPLAVFEDQGFDAAPRRRSEALRRTPNLLGAARESVFKIWKLTAFLKSSPDSA